MLQNQSDEDRMHHNQNQATCDSHHNICRGLPQKWEYIERKKTADSWQAKWIFRQIYQNTQIMDN